MVVMTISGASSLKYMTRGIWEYPAFRKIPHFWISAAAVWFLESNGWGQV